MRKVVQRPEAGQDVWIAIDVARSKWAFNVRWGGMEQRRLSTPGALEHLQSLVGQYEGCPVHVAYEACGFGYEIAWWCQEREIAVTVIPPSTLERAPGAHVKTDRVDAAAMNLKHEKGLLKCVHIPTRIEHEQRQLSRTYGQVLKDRKRAQMRLRSLMQEHGRLGPVPTAGWARYEVWLRRQEMPAPVALCMEQLLAARALAAQATLRLRAALRQLARQPEYKPVVQRLSQQAGVGWFTAIRLRLEIGDIRRFTTADSFVHYLGLTPSEYSSGETVHRGHLHNAFAATASGTGKTGNSDIVTPPLWRCARLAFAVCLGRRDGKESRSAVRGVLPAPVGPSGQEARNRGSGAPSGLTPTSTLVGRTREGREEQGGVREESRGGIGSLGSGSESPAARLPRVECLRVAPECPGLSGTSQSLAALDPIDLFRGTTRSTNDNWVTVPLRTRTNGRVADRGRFTGIQPTTTVATCCCARPTPPPRRLARWRPAPPLPRLQRAEWSAFTHSIP